MEGKIRLNMFSDREVYTYQNFIEFGNQTL